MFKSVKGLGQAECDGMNIFISLQKGWCGGLCSGRAGECELRLIIEQTLGI